MHHATVLVMFGTMKLEPNEKLKVALESDVCLKTVEKWHSGGRVSKKTVRRISDALERLGLTRAADEVAK